MQEEKEEEEDEPTPKKGRNKKKMMNNRDIKIQQPPMDYGMQHSQSQQQFKTAHSRKSAYAGVDPNYAPHPHYYPPRPLPDEGE